MLARTGIWEPDRSFFPSIPSPTIPNIFESYILLNHSGKGLIRNNSAVIHYFLILPRDNPYRNAFRLTHQAGQNLDNKKHLYYRILPAASSK